MLPDPNIPNIIFTTSSQIPLANFTLKNISMRKTAKRPKATKAINIIGRDFIASGINYTGETNHNITFAIKLNQPSLIVGWNATKNIIITETIIKANTIYHPMSCISSNAMKFTVLR